MTVAVIYKSEVTLPITSKNVAVVPIEQTIENLVNVLAPSVAKGVAQGSVPMEQSVESGLRADLPQALLNQFGGVGVTRSFLTGAISVHELSIVDAGVTHSGFVVIPSKIPIVEIVNISP